MNKGFTIDDTLKIKGIAILIMIIHHLFRLEEFTKGFDISFYPITVGRMAQLSTYFKICVPIFAFLSGYGILHSYKKMKDKKSFYVVRYFKLMPIFWATAIICYVFTQIHNGFFINYFFKKNIWEGIASLLLNFFGLSGLVGSQNFCDNWWYIGSSLVFIFLLPILYKYAKKYGWLNVGIGLIIIPRILGVPNVPTTGALPYIFSFYLGMYFEDQDIFHKVSNIKINKFLKLIVYIILLLFTYMIHTHYLRTIFYEFHFGFVPILVILFSYEYLINIPIISKVLEELGKNSYIMFLVHGVILTNYRTYLYSFSHAVISILVLTILSYIISVILIFILNKIKYFKFCDKIKNILVN